MGKFTPSDIQELSQYFHKVTNNVSTLPAYKDSGDSRLVTLTQGTKTGVYLYANNQIIQLGTGAIVTPNPNPVGGGGFVGGGSGSKSIIVVNQTISTNTNWTYTFPAPSKLLGLPDIYATIDGMFTSAMGYIYTPNEPYSFTVNVQNTEISTCSIKFAYQNT